MEVSRRNDKPPSRLMTPAEVAHYFRVDPKTVTRWAVAGRLTTIRTLGGHRRYDREEVLALAAPEQVRVPEKDVKPVTEKKAKGRTYR